MEKSESSSVMALRQMGKRRDRGDGREGEGEGEMRWMGDQGVNMYVGVGRFYTDAYRDGPTRVHTRARTGGHKYTRAYTQSTTYTHAVAETDRQIDKQNR